MQITRQSLSQRLASYAREETEAAADSEVGQGNARLAEAQAALMAAEQRFRRVRDRLFTLQRVIAAADDTSDFAELASQMAEHDALHRLVGTLEADRRESQRAQMARRERDMAWARAATLREQILIQLQRHGDEPLRHWYRDHGTAMFNQLDRLVGPTSPVEDGTRAA